jgi:hypothetical protein
MKYIAGSFLGFSVGIMFINLVLREHSQMYKEGLEAGKQCAMQRMIEECDSLIIENKIKQTEVRHDSVLFEENKAYQYWMEEMVKRRKAK